MTISLSGFAQSPVTVTIGTGTSETYSLPFDNFYKNTWTEMIYPVDEINVAGTIDSIAFQVSSAPTSTVTFSTITIYMGTTSEAEHATTSSWLPLADLTEVYSATNLEMPTTTGWQTIVLDQPFEYSGLENLVVVISKTMDSYNSSLKYNYTTSPVYSSLYRQSDSDASYAQHPGSSTGTRSTMLPNIQLYVTSSGDFCFPVANLTVTDITSEEATVSWSAPEDANGYVLEYKAKNIDWEDDDVVTVYPTDTFYNITGLDPNTYYNVRVANTCSFGNSAWKNVGIKTECVAISVAEMPYFEQFEDYANYSFPDCWTRIAGYSSTYEYPYVNNSATTAHAGTGYLYLSNTSAYPIIMALPQFEEDLSMLRLCFWMKPAGTTNYYGHVEVGVMTDLADPTTFTLIKSWSAVNIGSTNWAQYMVDFDTVDVDGGYIVFRRYVESTTSYGWYFDDVKVMPIPACEAPTELAFVGATTNSVTLKWNPGEESAFNVYFKALGDEEYVEISNVSLSDDSTYTLQDLLPTSNYSIYVSSICSDGTENAGDPIICMTTMIPVDLPYETDFSEESDQAWLLNNGTCSNYWTMGTIPDTTATALYITNDGTNPGYSVSNISVVSAAKLFTIGDAAQYQVSFDVKVGGESSYDYIKLFFAPETELYPAATTAPTWAGNSYSTYAFDFSDYMSQSTSSSNIAYKFNLTGGNIVHIDAIMSNPHENPDANSTAQVVFVWKNDGTGGTQPGAIISNLSVSVVACPNPENLAVTNLNSNSADISWEDNDGVSWTVEYGVHGFEHGEGTEIDVTGTPEVSLTDLNEQTSYDVYVTSTCIDGSQSFASFMTFTTPCEPLTTLPFTENFDSIPGSTSTTSSTNNLPTCWSYNNHGTNSSYSGYPIVYNSSTYAASGANSLRFYSYITAGTYDDQIAILPLFDPTLYPVNTLQLSFDARANSSYTLTLVVGVMSNPSDKTSFEPIDTLVISSTSYANFEVPLSQYEGLGGFIALKAPQPTSSYNSGYVDNIVVDLIPSCPKPLHLQVSNVTTNSVELSWTETGTATEWEIAYGAPGFDPNSEDVNVETAYSVPFELEGLNNSTIYQFYVRAVCDGSDYSDWSSAVQVATACDLVSVPYSENFNEYTTTVTSSSAPSSYPDDVMPLCWSFLNRSTSSSTYPSAFLTAYSSYAVSGNCLFFKSSLSTPIYAVLPEFDAVLNTLQITFTYRNEGTSESNGILSFGYMTNSADASSFVELASFPRITSMTEVTVVLDTVEATEGFMAFKYTGGTNNNYYVSLDDIFVQVIPTCPRPSEMTASNPTTTSLTLSWTAGGEETSWEIVYGPYGFDPEGENATLVTTDSNPFVVQGLTSSTQYEFYVRAICGTGDQSIWSNPCTGITACEAISVPYSENFDNYTSSTTSSTAPSSYPDDNLPLCWTFLNRSTTSSTYPSAFLSAYSAYAVSGNCLFFKSSSATPLYAVLPEFAANLNTLQITFTYRNEGTTASNGTLSLGYMTDLSDVTSFVELATYTQTTTLTEVTEMLNTIPASVTTGYIVFKYTGGTANNYYLSIDNVTVENIPACASPVKNSVTASDVDGHNATISFIDNDPEHNSWTVYYREASAAQDDAWLTEITSSTSVTLTNLTPETTYDVYVITNCATPEEVPDATHTIQFTTMVACPAPQNLAVSGITTNAATITWFSNADSFTLEYGEAGFTPGSGTTVTTTETTYELTGLATATSYTVNVTADCGVEGVSSSSSVYFATACETIALPYTENFDSYTGTTYTDANGIAPNCWTTYSTNTTYGAPHITSEGSYHYVHSDTNCMVFTCGAAGSDAYAALPAFDQSLNTLHLNFWRAMESTSYGTLTVGYVTNVSDMASTFVAVATIPSVSSSAGDTISVDFTGADIPANGNICFHWNHSSSYYSCCIDDIAVTSNGSGPGPVITNPTVATNAASGATQTTATLNATITNPDNVTVTAKGFEWKTTMGGTYAPVAGTGTGNTFTASLTNLTPNTSYTFKAFITYNGTTVYGDEMTFNTLPEEVQPCEVPTGLEASNITKESFTVTWNNNANVSSWNIQYRPLNGQLSSAVANTNHYDFTNLTAETTYQVQVQANCGDGNLSEWSDILTVTTLVDGIESYLLNSIALYPNPANEYVDVRIDGDVNVKSMEVFDVYGKLINTVNVIDNPTRINVSGLANGMYFVRVTTEQGVATKTFVKK